MPELIAGFPPETWERFRAQIDRALVSKDPKGLDYVKHQVCIEMLNECFGVDGWWQEVVSTWFQPQYEWGTAKEPRLGRAYAEAHVKLYIGAPGAEPVCRENIGSQVAGGDWSETRKGAVSEALKRAASLFGWAGNVYKTEAFSQHEEAANGRAQTQQQAPPTCDLDRAQYGADGRPANAAAERYDATHAQATYPDPETVTDHDTYLAAMAALSVKAQSSLDKAAKAAGYNPDDVASLVMADLQAIYAKALALKLAADAKKAGVAA